MELKAFIQFQKLFQRLTDNQVKELAKSTLEQFEEEGYRGVGYQALIDALYNTYASKNSSRMQTSISKRLKVEFKLPQNWKPVHAQTIFGSDGEEISLFPRRLIATYQTDYNPSNITSALKEWERLNFLDKTRGMDTRQIARFSREDPEVRKVYDAAQNRNVDYGLLLTLKTDSSTLTQDGRSIEYYDGKFLPHIRKLKLIIPKTTVEERKVLSEFCDRYQVPNKKLVDRLLGITD